MVISNLCRKEKVLSADNLNHGMDEATTLVYHPHQLMGSDEAKFYNAVNLRCRGGYAALRRLCGAAELNELDSADTDSERAAATSWQEIWERITDGGTSVNPNKEWEKLQHSGITLVLRNDPAFPPLLREIPCPPYGLYYRGAVTFPRRATVAIVGTRKATALGKKIAHDLAATLAERSCVVVSGLALGIDEAAHRGVLTASGATVAVLARGLDKVYPEQNKNVADRILTLGGGLVSEYPYGLPTLPHQFLERNRIVSGFSCATIVVEAPRRSGALITAYWALEQNRDVLVVPGPISHPNYRGSHHLIKQGAGLLTDVEDILAVLPPELLTAPAVTESDSIPTKSSLTAADEPQRQILKAVIKAGQPLTIETLVATTKLPPSLINRSLALLIIANRLQEQNGRYFIHENPHRR